MRTWRDNESCPRCRGNVVAPSVLPAPGRLTEVACLDCMARMCNDSEMLLPALNSSGDLPPGVHRATMAEAVARFGTGTPQRWQVSRRLERIHALACGTGKVARFVVFGSYVTGKPLPRDLDVFMVMDDDFDVTAVRGEAALVFDHMAADTYEGASVFWVRRMAALGGEEAAIADWQIKRDGTKRGIVEVIADDTQ